MFDIIYNCGSCAATPRMVGQATANYVGPVKGYKADDIAEITGLSEKEVEAL